MDMIKIGALFVITLAVAIELVIVVYAPRCEPSSTSLLIGGALLVGGCHVPRP